MHLSTYRIRYYLFLLFFFISHPYLCGSIGKYPITNFTPAEYKAGIQNIDFAQNRDMGLFVANNLGILSFNGNEWTTYAYNTGKKQRSLAFDESTNRLYIGSQGEFGYFEDKWNYTSLLGIIPGEFQDFDEVWDVFIYDGSVYFCTFQGIFVYDGNEVSMIQNEGGFNRTFFTGNELFTQSSEGELYIIEGEELKRIAHQGRSGQVLAGIIPKDEGYLIFYNSGKIEFSTSFETKNSYPELARVLNGKYVNHVMQLSDSRLVIATQRAGLFLFDLQTEVVENIDSEDGLQSNACLRTFQDHSGNLWVGMQSGIALVDINSPLRLISQDLKLQGSGYETYEREEGTYYTTSNGIYFLQKNAISSLFLPGTEGPAYGMQLINNRLYAGHHTGLFLLENGRASKMVATDGLWQVRQLRSNPEYIIGGTYSGLHLFKINDDGLLEDVQKIEGFTESSRFFEEDRKGSIWVGQYYKGLYQLRLDESLTVAEITKGPDSEDLTVGDHVILSRIDDELYIGTEKGIYKIDQNTDTIEEAELFSSVVGESWVYLLEQDNHKNVHIFTENLVGFFKQVSVNNYVYIPSSLFQLRQSFNNDLLRVSKNVNDGVFYNANEGFIYYNPNMEDRLVIEKKPVLNRVYNIAMDTVIFTRLPFESRSDSLQSIEIVEGTKVLQFLVGSFKFKDVNNQQFRYFLKGFDEEYGDWSNTTIKEYTNLTEGDYEFYVQTYNYLGEVVTSHPLKVKVNPPWYKTLLAKVLYIGFVFFILYLIIRYQRQYYKGKASRMEQVKLEELSVKQKELQDLKDEKIQSELRHVNNLLAASTMNLVVKNEFMENIKEEIKQVRTNGNVKDTQKALEKIVKEIDTTLKVQDDWRQFEYHFDQVHGDFLTRLTHQFVDLTPGEQKLCAFLRLKMDTKEIANLMGISLRGVEVARYRLRKKLGLDKHQNLSKFVLEY